MSIPLQAGEADLEMSQTDDANSNDDTKPQLIGGVLRAPASPNTKARRRQLSKGHVHWDEKAIAEHDKERGTRQKIDEPDTPFVHSPQTASDSEGGPASSDDEHHRGARSAQGAASSKTALGASFRLGDDMTTVQPAQEVDLSVVGSRLDDWMRMGGERRPSTGSSDGADVETSRPSSVCSSRSSSTAPAGRVSERKHSGEPRHIVWPEDSPQPKQASDVFRAKRAQHYNEIKALRAFKRSYTPSEESASETSNEDVSTTQTNTNTNINQTSSASKPRVYSKEGSELNQRASGDAAAAAEIAAIVVAATSEPSDGLPATPARSNIEAQADIPVERGPALAGITAPAASVKDTPEARSCAPAASVRINVTASGGETKAILFTGDEDNSAVDENFRRRRQQHYAGEAKNMARLLAARQESSEDSEDSGAESQ